MTQSDPTPNFIKSKNGNWGTSKKLSASPPPSFLSVKTKQWTIERRAHEERQQILGSECKSEEKGERRESKPLMSKTFFVKRWSLTLKYSGWQ